MDIVFRLFFLAILLSALLISGTYRKKAREEGDVIARRDEGGVILAIRMVFALPLLITLLLYISYPRLLTWSYLDLPSWLRWVGVGVGILVIPFLLSVFRNIGRNISETVLTKSDHELVMSGPYRTIRHPLYAGSITMLFCLSLIASNWFFLSYAVIALIVFRWIVIPREEEALIQFFGDEYRRYQERTGALFPRLL